MNVSVIGVGLIGGSAALDLKNSGKFDKVYGVDKNEEHAKKALELNLVDEMIALEEAIEKSDILILTIPVDAILTLVPYILDRVDKQVVIEMGSTKTKILDSIADHPQRGRYLAAHPMAGTEYSGPEAAVKNLFKDKIMVYVEAFKTDEDAFDLGEKVTHILGMNSIFMNAKEHDMHTAYVSHISHLTSFALALTVLEKEMSQGRIFELAGSGFESTVRLAKSSPHMWAPIFEQNRENVLEVLKEHIHQLQSMYDSIENKDFEHLKKMIKKSNRIKRIIK